MWTLKKTFLSDIWFCCTLVTGRCGGGNLGKKKVWKPRMRGLRLSSLTLTC